MAEVAHAFVLKCNRQFSDSLVVENVVHVESNWHGTLGHVQL